mmetsp:Transcript_9810/g.15077  ORF Transcript_9810/g.15077 Transcript_9810/m.15077 type:complete len:335 (-) Transcript_9810:104-1108(-)|eukprot:CAMPEP_0195302586 /NCGR_PEP_ID=MMETSP0707-20130614/31341_1 /TAXON_ID=33640 /ORGANISM="Asterionellopsis glacialis, Strain CCMP134" /LENGTH=334 /DNA_ID=CAMNT_0040365889 /DNA_START=44 /DNA_END=1048 /DNA_ORIENTATION=-
MRMTIQLPWVLFLLSCSAIGVSKTNAYSPISLTTTSSLSKTSAQTLYKFLGAPANWPKIVASSHSVVSPQGKDLGIPLKVSESVDEIFGLPPLLPLSVSWKCVKSIPPTNTKPGYLDFYSQDGLGGVATNCRMQFVIEDPPSSSSSSTAVDDTSCCNVKLDMSYEPVSPIAVLAIPALVIDNAVALQVLLPSVLTSQSSLSPLDKFRDLMGSLYGVAGVAHLADCLVDSQLLVTAGSQPFDLLPPLGKAYALLWCAAGPVSFGTSRIGGKVADLGLIFYGLVEVVGAYLIRFQSDVPAVTETSSNMMDPFMNAILVQGIVAAAWLYSSQRKDDQ